MVRTTTTKIALASLAGVAALLQGCASVPSSTPNNYNDAYNSTNPNYPYPAAGPVAAAPVAPAPYTYAPQQPSYEDAEAAAATKERLARVEKAMLRLDRRMQLIERNELNRMSGTSSATPNPITLGSNTPAAAPAPSPSIEDGEEAAMRALDIGPVQSHSVATTYRDGFRPVSDDGSTRIAMQNTGREVLGSAAASMPSLADNGPTPAGKAPQAATDVAVWTIRYPSADNLWPDRTQLPLSRDVVEALRNGSNVTLFARGPNPNGKQFRERVKALSRYLAKVTSLDSVPIAALPSPQMDAQTIEILATH